MACASMLCSIFDPSIKGQSSLKVDSNNLPSWSAIWQVRYDYSHKLFNFSFRTSQNHADKRAPGSYLSPSCCVNATIRLRSIRQVGTVEWSSNANDVLCATDVNIAPRT